MTEKEWRDKVLQISSNLKDRRALGDAIVENPGLLRFCFEILKSTDIELRTKSAYTLDSALRKKLDLFLNFKAEFFEALPKIKLDVEKRVFAKILEGVTTSHFKYRKIQLTKPEQQKIITICFDWLIESNPVAVKVFAMQSIYNLSETQDWIAPELKAQLDIQFETASAGFKSRASKILKKLKT